jgi:hypothetical protein
VSRNDAMSVSSRNGPNHCAAQSCVALGPLRRYSPFLPCDSQALRLMLSAQISPASMKVWVGFCALSSRTLRILRPPRLRTDYQVRVLKLPNGNATGDQTPETRAVLKIPVEFLLRQVINTPISHCDISLVPPSSQMANFRTLTKRLLQHSSRCSENVGLTVFASGYCRAVRKPPTVVP